MRTRRGRGCWQRRETVEKHISHSCEGGKPIILSRAYLHHKANQKRLAEVTVDMPEFVETRGRVGSPCWN